MASTLLLRYAWALPATALGMLASLPFFAFGATGAIRAGVLEVTLKPSSAKKRLTSFPFVAVTLGHVVIAATAAHQEQLRTHELVHVAQYERWGPLFLVAYPLESLLQLFRGRRPYLDNRFEVQARSVANAMAAAAARGNA